MSQINPNGGAQWSPPEMYDAPEGFPEGSKPARAPEGDSYGTFRAYWPARGHEGFGRDNCSPCFRETPPLIDKGPVQIDRLTPDRRGWPRLRRIGPEILGRLGRNQITDLIQQLLQALKRFQGGNDTFDIRPGNNEPTARLAPYTPGENGQSETPPKGSWHLRNQGSFGVAHDLGRSMADNWNRDFQGHPGPQNESESENWMPQVGGDNSAWLNR